MPIYPNKIINKKSSQAKNSQKLDLSDFAERVEKIEKGMNQDSNTGKGFI